MRGARFISLVFISMIVMAPMAFASSITTYTYDANGNMLSDGKFNYTYNPANQMTMAIKADTGDFVEEYLYDHSGNRVKKIESADGGNKTTYYISGLYEVTIDENGSMTNTTYVYANGERVARNETNENGSTVYYYHSDHLHSTSVVTTQGNLIANITEANSNWTTITLEKSLARPVVIAKITSENETDNAEIRLSNTSSDSFILKIEETDIFDGSHPNETISYIALEEGIIANGAEDIGEAGTIEAGPIWTRVTFTETFNEAPVVIASPMTQNDAAQGVVRVRNIAKNGFDIRFEEYDGSDHPLETIGWIAVKPGMHTLDGNTIVAGSTSASSNYSSVSLSGFSTAPAIITQIHSHNEADYASHTRVTNASTTNFKIKIEEQNDMAHTTETVGYIAIEPTTLKSGHAKVSETKYYPYGVIQEGGSERYLYTGKEMDAGTGLYYYEARYYSPSVGGFIQADTMIPNPYNPQSLNRYSYVLNNPLRYTDPSGHNEKAVVAGASMIIGGALIIINAVPSPKSPKNAVKSVKNPLRIFAQVELGIGSIGTGLGLFGAGSVGLASRYAGLITEDEDDYVSNQAILESSRTVGGRYIMAASSYVDVKVDQITGNSEFAHDTARSVATSLNLISTPAKSIGTNLNRANKLVSTFTSLYQLYMAGETTAKYINNWLIGDSTISDNNLYCPVQRSGNYNGDIGANEDATGIRGGSGTGHSSGWGKGNYNSDTGGYFDPGTGVMHY